MLSAVTATGVPASSPSASVCYLNTRYFKGQRGVIRDAGELDVQLVSHHKGIAVGFLKGQRGRLSPRTCASGSNDSRVSLGFHSDDDDR